jgi:hypothetical protein
VSDIQIIAFGDLEAGAWGFAWLAEPGGRVQVAVARGSTAQVIEGTLGSGGGDGAWRLQGDGLSLEVVPTGPIAHGGVTEELQTLDQACTIVGQVGIESGSLELHSPGWRSSGRSRTALQKVDSLRWLAAWLGPEHGFSLLALRPRRARGQEDDAVAATVIDDPEVPRIDDPRLSTTYNESGLPVKVGLELWFEAETEADTAEDGERPPPFPRRAAGQVVSQGPDLIAGGFALHGSLLRWRSHDREGPGVYVLGRRR